MIALKRLLRVERRRHSVDGNPRFRCYFDDGVVATTKTDASIAFTIESMAGRDVRVEFDRAGLIVDCARVATELPIGENL